MIIIKMALLLVAQIIYNWRDNRIKNDWPYTRKKVVNRHDN